MRLWTLNPRYLDPKGLVALWREALLAQAVLKGLTVGYRHHPQLVRFKSSPSPRAAIASYLRAVYEEALARGYSFDASKIGRGRAGIKLAETRGQLEHEWRHLQAKLRKRDPAWLRQWKNTLTPEPHPLFRVVPGQVRAWESVESGPAAGIKPARTNTRTPLRKAKL